MRRRWRHRRRSVHSNRVGWASEPRKWDIAGAEAVGSAEGNTNGAVMQGAATLPWSRTPSRWKGSRRNLGDLTSPAAAAADTGHVGKSRRRSRRGRGEESDGCIVPVKPRTMPAHVGGGDGGGKAAGRREGEQRRMPRTQRAELGMSQSCEPADRSCTGRLRLGASIALDLRQEPGAGKPHAGICAGGPG